MSGTTEEIVENLGSWVDATGNFRREQHRQACRPRSPLRDAAQDRCRGNARVLGPIAMTRLKPKIAGTGL
jgi:hypothetical protein